MRRITCGIKWLGLATAATVASCAGPGSAEGGPDGSGKGGPGSAAARAAVRHELPPGTVLRLRPAAAHAGFPGDADSSAALDGVLREALRVSARFDIAGGVEDTAAPHEIAAHYDKPTRTLTTTLHITGRPPVPLTAAAGAWTDVVDAVALATRQALGERTTTKPRTIARIYSKDIACLEATERGTADAFGGRVRRATAEFQRARRADPGCTITLAALSAALLATGQAEQAARTAREALSYQDRLAPTTRHRLAHVLLVAQGQLRGAGSNSDAELLRFADVAITERPYDPHPRYSRALALNFRSRYEESVAELRALHRRWPKHAGVAYHLTFAELGVGRYDAALEAIESARDRLPSGSGVLPRSLALFHTGKHAVLEQWLAELAKSPAVHNSAQLHELRRMQISHALLTDRLTRAITVALEDLEWIRRRRSQLDRYALHVAELGEVLVRLDEHARLRLPLQAFEELGNPPEAFAHVLVYLGGLVQVASKRERANAAEAHLRKANHRVWSSALKAAAHRRRGELMDELKERLVEYTTTTSPLYQASLARVLRQAGDDEDARDVLAALRKQLLSFDLRRLQEHPLLSPGAALAYLLLPDR